MNVEETKIEGGPLWYLRARKIEDFNQNREQVRDAEKLLMDFLRIRMGLGQAVATIHPTYIGELFNAVLDGILIMSYPKRACEVKFVNEPHHAHDGRISCEMAILAESYRAPYI